MPRPVKQLHGRFVRPEIFKDSELIKLELRMKAMCQVRLVLIGVWEYADKRGRFEWDTFRMHTELMPHLAFETFEAIIEALREGRWLCHFTAGNGKEFGHVRTWNKYQRTHRKERDSVLPVCSVCGEDDTPDAVEDEDEDDEISAPRKSKSKKQAKSVQETESECERCLGRRTIYRPDPRPGFHYGTHVPCPVCQPQQEEQL